MMREVLVAIFLVLLCCQPLLADNSVYLSGGCGTGNVGANNIPNPTVDNAGRNCIGLYYTYKNITGDATTSVKSGAGVLHSITFNNPVATETVTISTTWPSSPG
jgi:hypothetical protein